MLGHRRRDARCGTSRRCSGPATLRHHTTGAPRPLRRGRLRNVCAADAVFDDPCGTSAQKGIVRGFELIHWLCVLTSSPPRRVELAPPAAGGLVFSEDAVPSAGAGAVTTATYTLRALPLSGSRCLRQSSSTSTSRSERLLATDRWRGRPVTLTVHRTLKEWHGFWFVALFVK